MRCHVVLQVRAQQLRECYREAARKIKPNTSSYEADMQRARETFPAEALADGGDSVQVPFTADGLKLALLNAERWAAGLDSCVCLPL
jgi:hypothetical protein